MDSKDLIRKFRKEQGLTQIELAQKAGVAVNSLRLFETGKRQPRLNQLHCLANALNIPVATLLGDRPPVETMAPNNSNNPCDVQDNMTWSKLMKFYPTEKGTVIFIIMYPDDTVDVFLNYPMVPAAEAMSWRLSIEDAEHVETIVKACFSKTAEPRLPAEVGSGILQMLDKFAEKNRRSAELSKEQAESNTDI